MPGATTLLGNHHHAHAREGEARTPTGAIPGTPVRATFRTDGGGGGGSHSRSEHLQNAGPPLSVSSRGDVSPARSWVGPPPLPAGLDPRGPRARSVPAVRKDIV